MFDDQSNVSGLTASCSGSAVTPRTFMAAVTGPPSPPHSCPTCTGRIPAQAALLTDRKLPATLSFAVAHGCATAAAGANSATAAMAPAPARTPLKPLPINLLLSPVAHTALPKRELIKF